jgi:hypothetical protein
MDSDNNGIPDYIEELTKDEDARKEYSNSVLDSMFKDSDRD